MPLDIGSIFRTALDEFLTRKAGILLGVFLVVGVFGSIAGDSFALASLESLADAVRETQGSLPPDLSDQVDAQREQLRWALEVGFGTASVLLVTSFLVGELARIPAVRGLADTTTDTLDRSHYATNVGSIFLNRVLVAIITFVLVAVTALLTVVIPGAIFAPLALLGVVPLLYVVLGLFFASYAVTIDEDSALDGIQRSWRYVNGNRLRLLLIGLVVLVVTFLLGLPMGLLLGLDGTTGGLMATLERSPAALVVGAVTGTITTVFTIAVAAQTYRELDRAASGVDAGAEPAFDDIERDSTI